MGGVVEWNDGTPIYNPDSAYSQMMAHRVKPSELSLMPSSMIKAWRARQCPCIRTHSSLGGHVSTSRCVGMPVRP
ncbi:hypothetical protein BD310DRAFT_912603 [Dichomitus squalens]|uniref:Uncharacterized protein n=1 Tax=Dichomitus squalens TaxID=114155 RepID=A0A4Q9QE03_9APHY|nr:hypothetical protein BD310DRAFT_912603 [Dichomitus squalens]